MTCQGISLGLVSIGCCFFLSVTRRGLLFVLHTENHGRSRGFFVPNFRIFEFFSSHGESRNNLFYHELSNIFHTECRGDHGLSLSRFFSLSRICEFANFFHTENRGDHGFSYYHELSNYRISFTRKVAECRGFFIPRLVLGPTDRREVICELFLHTKCRGWLWGLLFMRMGAIRRCL